MGVEQDGLRGIEGCRKFYEIKSRRLAGAIEARCIQRDTRGAQKRPASGLASLSRLITMKLGHSRWYILARCYDFCSDLIYKQQHWRDKRRQATGQLGCTLRRNTARAGLVQHKAHCVGTGLSGGVYVLLARQAANFDACSLCGCVVARASRAA